MGSRQYLRDAAERAVLRTRLGDIALQTLDYGERIVHNGVTISLHPAGHVLGSAQVRLEHAGEVWVASGDYKTRARSDLPAVRGGALRHVHQRVDVRPADLPLAGSAGRSFADIAAWWRGNADAGRASVLYCYAFGKAQRVLAGVRDAGALDIGPMVCHGAVEVLNEAYRQTGVELPPTQRVDDVDAAAMRRALVLAPPSAAGTPVAASFRRPERRVRVRLDAAARRAPSARTRSRLRAVRPRRLARLAGGDRRDGRAARHRHPRPGRGDGALALASRGSMRRRSTPSTTRTRPRRAREGLRAACTSSSTRRRRPAASSPRSSATTRCADAADAAWATYFLAGGRPRQAVPTRLLRECAIERSRARRVAVRGVLPGGRRLRRDRRARAAAARARFGRRPRGVGRRGCNRCAGRLPTSFASACSRTGTSSTGTAVF